MATNAFGMGVDKAGRADGDPLRHPREPGRLLPGGRPGRAGRQAVEPRRDAVPPGGRGHAAIAGGGAEADRGRSWSRIEEGDRGRALHVRPPGVQGAPDRPSDEALKGGTIGAAVARLEDLGLVRRREDGKWECVHPDADLHELADQGRPRPGGVPRVPAGPGRPDEGLRRDDRLPAVDAAELLRRAGRRRVLGQCDNCRTGAARQTHDGPRPADRRRNTRTRSAATSATPSTASASSWSTGPTRSTVLFDTSRAQGAGDGVRRSSHHLLEPIV